MMKASDSWMYVPDPPLGACLGQGVLMGSIRILRLQLLVGRKDFGSPCVVTAFS